MTLSQTTHKERTNGPVNRTVRFEAHEHKWLNYLVGLRTSRFLNVAEKEEHESESLSHSLVKTNCLEPKWSSGHSFQSSGHIHSTKQKVD